MLNRSFGFKFLYAQEFFYSFYYLYDLDHDPSLISSKLILILGTGH